MKSIILGRERVDRSGKDSFTGYFDIKEEGWDTWITVRDDDGMPFSLLPGIAQFAGRHVKVTVEAVRDERGPGPEPPLVYKMCGMTRKNFSKENRKRHSFWMKKARGGK